LNINQFVFASSLEEAYQLLNESKKNKVLAGGAWLKLSVKDVDKMISLDRLSLDYFRETEEEIEIGAMTCLRDIEEHTTIKNLYSGILSSAIGHIMGVSVRNLATIGGSIMGKFSFSDILPVLMVMDVKLKFFHHGIVDIETYMNDRIYQRDVLKSLIIKKDEGQGYFRSVSVTPLDFAMVNLAIVKRDGFSVAIGSRPGPALFAKDTMQALNKMQSFDGKDLDQVSKICLDEIGLGKNLRASKEYRQVLVQTYLKRGIKQVIS
jgi:CO/xanthine dehydrogenase FAD-binding subunit